MAWLGRAWRWDRGVFLTLAMLAVAMKIAVPAGYMTRAASNDLPFALVLCTADGAVTVAPGEVLPADHDKSRDTKHDAPCAFAGHGVGVAPPNLLDFRAVQFVAYQAVTASPVVDLAPGRGLAAPPLPARGPPSLLI